MTDWRATALWQETRAVPDALERTLETCATDELVTLLGRPHVKRIVASGNGAAYYAAVALWLAALAGRPGPEVIAVPAGLLVTDSFRWHDSDVLLAFSTSGELKDLVDAIGDAPSPYAAITASPASTIGSRAGAVGRVVVASQNAVTHTQGFCGNVLVALEAWARLTGDATLSAAVAATPDLARRCVEEAETWLAGLDSLDTPAAAAVFGSGPAWAGALEGALLLKEVAGVPAEGVETREGATSAMYAMRAGHLAVSLLAAEDPKAQEAELACAARGATVLRLPAGAPADRRLAAIATFPALVALSAALGSAGGLDVDSPSWTDTYYAVARVAT